MARALWEYFDERNAECKRLGLPHLHEPGYFERAGSDGRRGRLWMTLSMNEEANAVLSISERVVVHDGFVHREEYAYYLIIDGQEYRAWDFDSIHGYHGHQGADHERVEGDRVTFKEVVSLVWEILSSEEYLTDSP